MKRTEKETNAFLKYENELLKLKTIAFRKCLSITINSNDGLFEIYTDDINDNLINKFEFKKDVEKFLSFIPD